jgi:hypothetical protein
MDTELCDLVVIEPLPPVMIRMQLIAPDGSQVECLLDRRDTLEAILKLIGALHRLQGHDHA